MDREFLKNIGLEKEQIDAIMSEHGKTITSYLGQVNDLTTKNTDLTARMDAFKDYDGIKKQLEDVKAEFESYKTTSQSELEKSQSALSNIKLSHAIDLAVEREHSRDAKAFMAHLDTSKITLDENGALVGFDEQSKSIHENQAYLFETNKATGVPSGTLSNDDGRTMSMLDSVKDHYK